MKKWIVIPVIILIVAMICIYVFIPNKLAVSNIEIVHIRQSSAQRYLSNKYQWAKWWTVSNEKGHKSMLDSNNLFNYNNDLYEVKNNTFTGAAITIYHQQKTVESNIAIYSISKDTIAIQWKFDIATGLNPIKKLMDYNEAVGIKKNMTNVLSRLKTFLENNKNIYGVDIKHDTITDVLLMSERAVFINYPTSTDIYKIIDELKKYTLGQNASSTGTPMLNVTFNKGNYETMVAIPINKPISNNGKMLLKRIVPGTPILVAQVNGGHYTTANALAQLENYRQDYQKSSPAIPYELLITDRSKETDTTKWVTKLCYPLFPW